MAFSEHFRKVMEELRQEDSSFDEFAAAFHRFQDDLEDFVLSSRVPRRQIEQYGGAQSKQYMIDLLPTIQRHMRSFPKKSHFSILDVGPGAGFGSNLLGSMYRSDLLGYTATVHTTDIIPDYINFAKAFCRHIEPMQVNIFELKERYDIVIASHVIEHIKEWQPFVRQLREISKGIVIVSAPYREDPSRLTRGHKNIFDAASIGKMRPERVEFVESAAWGQFKKPRYKMFIAQLTGKHAPARKLRFSASIRGLLRRATYGLTF